MARSRKGKRPASTQRGSTAPVSPDGKGNTLTPSDNIQDVYAPAQAQPTRRVTGKRILIGIGAVVLLVLLGGGGWAWWTVQRSLPTLDGTSRLEGLSAPATVTRDVYGVPHIVAANVEDLYASQGYVHAQDRLFQMFYYRQLSAGSLAEVFGPAAEGADIFLRTIGMRRAAEAEWKEVSPEVRAALEAYSRGVNAFLRERGDALPIEFGLIGVKMEDWQPVDTIAFGKVMAWDLTESWQLDLVTSDLRAKLGPERTAQLFPDYPVSGPAIVPGANSGGMAPAMRAFDAAVGAWLPRTGIDGIGSNNWVVDGSKSATGKPLLANDPHLGVQNPSIWYQVHLSTSDGKYDAAGFGFAGVPGIVTGHNQNIAWGATNVGGDVQDLFIEKLDPAAHPGQYQTPNGWEPLQALTETILVKSSEAITHTVRLTRHGPILTDALIAISSTIGASIKEPLAFQWSASEPGHILDSLYALQTAQNWQEFRAALSKWTVPGQNFVYADREGNIGYQMTGEHPIRSEGDGSVPVPGWTGEYDWAGYTRFDDLPRSYNPPEHFIATANNKPFGSDYKQPIEGHWSPPWRATKIVEMLKAKDKLSVDDYKQMLTDTRSLMVANVAPYFAGLKSSDTKTQEALALLNSWDGNLIADSSAATLYELTVQKALSETFADDLGGDLFVQYLGEGGTTVLRAFELLLEKPDDPFWDKKDTSATEKRDDILLLSLSDSLADLTRVIGPDPKEWTWGKVHIVTPKHRILGDQPVVSGVFNLQSLPLGGDGTTVSVAGFGLLNPFDVTHHQSYRMIIDLSDWSKSLGIFATGQSGQPFSKHWGDMFAPWQRGEFNPILYTEEEIEAKKEAVLTLTP